MCSGSVGGPAAIQADHAWERQLVLDRRAKFAMALKVHSAHRLRARPRRRARRQLRPGCRRRRPCGVREGKPAARRDAGRQQFRNLPKGQRRFVANGSNPPDPVGRLAQAKGTVRPQKVNRQSDASKRSAMCHKPTSVLAPKCFRISWPRGQSKCNGGNPADRAQSTSALCGKLRKPKTLNDAI